MFRKLFFLAVITILVTSISFRAGNYLRDRYLLPASTVNNNSNFNPTVSSETQSYLYSTPTRIEISAIGVDTKVEEVGLTETGSMDAPSNPNEVAWYKNGPKPGETGSSVIDGHFDSLTGPAVFYKLDELKTGDIVKVTESNGKVLIFQVYKTASYPNDSFPIDQIFSSNNQAATLNLITCEGVWDKSAKEYSNRRVIFTRLINVI